MSLHFKTNPGVFVDATSRGRSRPVFFEVKPTLTGVVGAEGDGVGNQLGNFMSKTGSTFPANHVSREPYPGSINPEKGYNDLPKDVVYENGKPVFAILRLLGVLPITRTAPGSTVFKMGSASMAYSAFIFVLILLYVYFVALNRVKIIRNLEGRFEEAIIAYLFLVNLVPIIIIPMMWYEAKKVAQLLNNWSDFEVLYFKTSGRWLPINLRKKMLVIGILIPVLSTISVTLTHVTMVDFHLSQVIPYCLLDMITYMMGAYWYFACQMLSSAASILADDFQTALRHIGPAGMVAEFRSLWLRLSRLARDTGIATSYTFTFITLYMFFIITISIYGLMSKISEGFGIKDIGLTVTAFTSCYLLFVICDEGHFSAQNIRTNFQKKLLMVELSWMNTDAQTEINMFLRATEMNPSNINLGGYYDVNRNLFKSLLATMVTYLVVLLQFQISIPDESLSVQQQPQLGNNTIAISTTLSPQATPL